MADRKKKLNLFGDLKGAPMGRFFNGLVAARGNGKATLTRSVCGLLRLLPYGAARNDGLEEVCGLLCLILFAMTRRENKHKKTLKSDKPVGKRFQGETLR